MLSAGIVLVVALAFLAGQGIMPRTPTVDDIVGGGPVGHTSPAAPAPTTNDIVGGGPVG
jgi:hypothetical protein